MYYAVNLADITKPEYTLAASIMVGPVQGPTVKAEPGRIGGVAVRLDCDEERAKAIISVFRLKAQKHELRCYASKTGKNWRRI